VYLLGMPALGVPALPETMKSTLRFSQVCGSTPPRVEDIKMERGRYSRKAIARRIEKCQKHFPAFKSAKKRGW
jgi:hypothetical protein